MSLIPNQQLLVSLVDASAAKEIADTSPDNILEMQVAACINSAAVCGQHRALWQHEMPDTLKATLEGRGYQVLQDNSAADPSIRWIIGGF